MAQPDVERLLKGYRLPDVPASLDQRILAEAENRLFLIRARMVLGEAASWMSDLLGLGYIGWIVAWLAGFETDHQITIVL